MIVFYVNKNLIVKGKFKRWVAAYPSEPKDVHKESDKIHSYITHYFENNGFFQRSSPSLIYDYANFEFETMTLHPNFAPPPDKDIFGRVKKHKTNPYFDQLRTLKIGAPTRLSVNTTITIDKNGVFLIIEIISEPAIIQQFQQLGFRPSLNQDEIDIIIYENEQLIERFGKACHLDTVKKPTPLDAFYKTDISEKLRFFGFTEISKLLEEGREDIEKGRTEDGLVDLRTALDKFFIKVLEMKGKKPAQEIDKNLDKLRAFGYIDEYTQKLLLKLSYHGLHTTLSNVTHDRIPRDYFDSRFQFNVAEQIFDYVLERVIRLNLTNAQIKNEEK